VGACCWNGDCTDVSAAECADLSGEYQGDGTSCATADCPPPAEYVIWYTANVCCWGAPLIYITDRAGFEERESRASFPGGGIDHSIDAVKVAYLAGFDTMEAAQAWICPQFTSKSYHYWCGHHYQMDGMNWQPGGLGCDLSNLPVTDSPPDANLCEL
jgi:hypothetical protein